MFQLQLWAQDNLQLHQPWEDQFSIVLLLQYDLITLVQSCQIHIWTIYHTTFPFSKYSILSLHALHVHPKSY
jgi:hypothetical protein